MPKSRALVKNYKMNEAKKRISEVILNKSKVYYPTNVLA